MAILLGAPYAYFTLMAKALLGSIFAGNISAVLYSLPSGIIALTIELLALNLTNRVSLTAISVVGAVINNIIQNVVFCLITGVWEYMSYIPYLIMIGALSGLVVGIIVYLIVKILPQSLYDKINK
jgi:heptaprenyl diphosphate synthase